MHLIDLIEALKPSQYRPLVKSWDKNRYAEIVQSSTLEKDRNAYRLYIPLESNDEEITPLPSVEKEVISKGYKIYDYRKGLAIDKYDRKIKIGKILSKDVRDEFNNDDRRQGNNANYMAVISRHPYDIAGMSTDRGWTSCMNLSGGEFCEYVPIDIKNGTLIAYLIKSNDLDIKNPIGRVVIKIYTNPDYPDDVMFGVGKVYGSDIDNFSKVVDEWADKINNSHELDGFILFKLSADSYDDNKSAIYIGNPTTDNITSHEAYDYAREVINGRWIEGEDIIATSPQYSLYYAALVLSDKFDKGEKVIATNARWSYEYAIYVLHGRFPEGEEAISKNIKYSKLYAEKIMHDINYFDK